MNDGSNPAPPAVSGTSEPPAVGDISGTHEPCTTTNESGPLQSPGILSQITNMAQDMTNIDPQLRPPSATASTASTEAPNPAPNSSAFDFQPMHDFAPQETSGSPASVPAATHLLGGSPAPPTPPLAPATSTALPHTPLSDIPPTPPTSTAPLQPATANKVAAAKKARKRPGVRGASALQKVAEKAIAEKAAVVEKNVAWSKELTKAVKVAEARIAKAAETKATKAAKAAEAKAAKAAQATEAAEAAAAAAITAAEDVSAQTSDMSDAPAVLQPGRSQRVRKAASSKEVVPLTDKRKRQDSKENDA